MSRGSACLASHPISEGVKFLRVPYTDAVSKTSSIGAVSSFLDSMERTPIDTVPWVAFPEKPEVQFAIAHTDDCLFLKYYVKERFIRAHHVTHNAYVSDDSCVEFFVSFDDGSHYYNFEFNCIGTCKVGFGPREKSKRVYLPGEVIDGFERQSSIKSGGRLAGGLFSWELAVALPSSAFIHHEGLTLKGRQARANFYKCGDRLPEPHFVVWNHVDSDAPDFHRPADFGKLLFL